jgi:uncharacterized membrane protein
MASNSTGLQENVAGALSYLFGWITGIIFYLLEPNKPFVRFHAVQSIITFGILTILIFIISWIPVLGWILSFVIWAIWIILWLVLMIKAYQGERFKLPVIGDMAEKFASK